MSRSTPDAHTGSVTVINVPECHELRYRPQQRVAHVLRMEGNDPPNVELIRHGRMAIVLMTAYKTFAGDYGAIEQCMRRFREVADADGNPIWGRSPFSGCVTQIRGDTVHCFSVTECSDAVMRTYYRKLGGGLTGDEVLEAQAVAVANTIDRARANVIGAMGGGNVHGMTTMVGNVLRRNAGTGKLEFLSGAFDTCGYQSGGTRNPNIVIQKPWLSIFVPYINGWMVDLLYDAEAGVYFPRHRGCMSAPRGMIKSMHPTVRERNVSAVPEWAVSTVRFTPEAPDPRDDLDLRPFVLDNAGMTSTSACGGLPCEATGVIASPQTYDVFTQYHIQDMHTRMEMFVDGLGAMSGLRVSEDDGDVESGTGRSRPAARLE